MSKVQVDVRLTAVVGSWWRYRYDSSAGPRVRRSRSLWILDQRGDLMAQAPLYYQLHALIGLVLVALWP
jgi:nitrate reductase gamma subunit